MRTFAPFMNVATTIGRKDVMVVGKGKPLLRRGEDGQRLGRHAGSFEALQRKYAKHDADNVERRRRRG